MQHTRLKHEQDSFKKRVREKDETPFQPRKRQRDDEQGAWTNKSIRNVSPSRKRERDEKKEETPAREKRARNTHKENIATICKYLREERNGRYHFTADEQALDNLILFIKSRALSFGHVSLILHRVSLLWTKAPASKIKSLLALLINNLHILPSDHPSYDNSFDLCDFICGIGQLLENKHLPQFFSDVKNRDYILNLIEAFIHRLHYATVKSCAMMLKGIIKCAPYLKLALSEIEYTRFQQTILKIDGYLLATSHSSATTASVVLSICNRLKKDVFIPPTPNSSPESEQNWQKLNANLLQSLEVMNDEKKIQDCKLVDAALLISCIGDLIQLVPSNEAFFNAAIPVVFQLILLIKKFYYHYDPKTDTTPYPYSDTFRSEMIQCNLLNGLGKIAETSRFALAETHSLLSMAVQLFEWMSESRITIKSIEIGFDGISRLFTYLKIDASKEMKLWPRTERASLRILKEAAKQKSTSSMASIIRSISALVYPRAIITTLSTDEYPCGETHLLSLLEKTNRSQVFRYHLEIVLTSIGFIAHQKLFGHMDSYFHQQITEEWLKLLEKTRGITFKAEHIALIVEAILQLYRQPAFQAALLTNAARIEVVVKELWTQFTADLSKPEISENLLRALNELHQAKLISALPVNPSSTEGKIYPLIALIRGTPFKDRATDAMAQLQAMVEACQHKLFGEIDEVTKKAITENLAPLVDSLMQKRKNARMIQDLFSCLCTLHQLGFRYLPEETVLKTLVFEFTKMLSTRSVNKEFHVDKMLGHFIYLFDKADLVSFFSDDDMVNYVKTIFNHLLTKQISEETLFNCLRLIICISRHDAMYFSQMRSYFSRFLTLMPNKYPSLTHVELLLNLLRQFSEKQGHNLSVEDKENIRKLAQHFNKEIPAYAVSFLEGKEKGKEKEEKVTTKVERISKREESETISMDPAGFFVDPQPSGEKPIYLIHTHDTEATGEFLAYCQAQGIHYDNVVLPGTAKFTLGISYSAPLEQLGLSAVEPMRLNGKKRKLIGIYHGETKEFLTPADDDDDYIFNVGDFYVSSKRMGNFTRFLNDSTTPNVEVEDAINEETGELQLRMYLISDAEIGQPLTINYRNAYFDSEPKIARLFLNNHDINKMPADIYLENKTQYLGRLFKVNPAFTTMFHLPEPTLLITDLFYSVYLGNTERVRSILLSEGTNPNLQAYCVPDEDTTDTILPFRQQALITPLMIACYLGQSDIVELLLNHPSIEVDDRTLHRGESAFFFLFKSLATTEEKLKIARLLIKAGANLSMECLEEDHYHDLLYMCIKHNETQLAALILAGSDEAREACILHLLEREVNDNDLIHCILTGKLDMLRLLLQHIKPEFFCETAVTNPFLMKKAILEAPLAYLKEALDSLINVTKIHTNIALMWQIRSSLVLRQKQITPEEKVQMDAIIQQLHHAISTETYPKKDQLKRNQLLKYLKQMQNSPGASVATNSLFAVSKTAGVVEMRSQVPTPAKGKQKSQNGGDFP